MRHIICQNDECASKGAPHFDFEPDKTIVLCPVCEKAMSVSTLEAIEQAVADRETEQAAFALELPPSPPPSSSSSSALDTLAALPADRVVTVSDLLAILRPEPATEEKPDA